MDEQSIFLNALEQSSPEAQAAWLDEACGEDESLKRRLLKMLQQHEQAKGFLEQPAAGLCETILSHDNGEGLAACLNAGMAVTFGGESAVVIGDASHSVLRSVCNSLSEIPNVSLRASEGEGGDPVARPNSPEMAKSDSDCRYRLDGEIARGGMGAIIKGRDTDLGRDLAIKVLLDSHKGKPEVIQRFVEEAQIGGQLQHPGIVPVYELGQFADKRPYFSMKLVRGQTLSKLLREREDIAEDRARFLGIFEQVCQTMAYAHSRGVIHRDLKPANIMVGAFGEVQVMDWGLAKVIPAGGIADEKQAHRAHKDLSIIQTMRSIGSHTPGAFGSFGSETQMGSVMGTPAYMPPEQALGEIDNMDERADVFGLGAILCEILTGKPPYVADDGTMVYRMASRGKLAEAFERLDVSGADADLIRLTRDCLELEPADRPRDAGVLAAKVTDYLESAEERLWETEKQRAAEAARADESRKRHRVTLTLAGAMLLVLTAGIAGTTWHAHRADEARLAEADRAGGERLAKLAAQQAQQEAQAANLQSQERLAQVERGNEILTSIFIDLNMNTVREGTEPLEAVLASRLVKAAKQLEGESVGDPLAVAHMQDRLGVALLSLGFPSEAIGPLSQALTTREERLGSEHADTLNLMRSLAVAYRDTDQLDLALPLFEEIVTVRKAMLGNEHHSTLHSMANLAEAYRVGKRLDLALPLFEETLQRQTETLGTRHTETLDTMSNLASSYCNAGNPELALPLAEEVLRIKQTILGAEHIGTLGTMGGLAVTYREAGKLDLALSLFQETLQLCKATLGAEHPQTLMCMHNLAVTYQDAGKLDLALPLLEETLKMRQAKLGVDHAGTLSSMHSLVVAYRTSGKPDLAVPLAKEALKLTSAKLGADHPETLLNMHYLAVACQAAGMQDLALPLFEETLQLRQATLGLDHPDTLLSMHSLAFAYLSDRKRDQALPFFERIRELKSAKLGADHPETLASMHNLASAYLASGEPDRALPLFEETVRLKRAILGADHADTLQSMAKLSVTYQRAGRPADASALAREIFANGGELLPEEGHPLAAQLTHLGHLQLQEKEYAEAENIFRECLAIREKVMADDWQLFNTKSLLGAALWGQSKFDEAEPLLLEGYEGMLEREQAIPAKEEHLRPAIHRLIRLYRSIDQPDKVRQWEAESDRHNSTLKDPPAS